MAAATYLAAPRTRASSSPTFSSGNSEAQHDRLVLGQLLEGLGRARAPGVVLEVVGVDGDLVENLGDDQAVVTLEEWRKFPLFARTSAIAGLSGRLAGWRAGGLAGVLACTDGGQRPCRGILWLPRETVAVKADVCLRLSVERTPEHQHTSSPSAGPTPSPFTPFSMEASQKPCMRG